MSDTEARAEEKVEITPEMVETGRRAYAEEAGHDPNEAELVAGLKAAFIAMLKASRLYRS